MAGKKSIAEVVWFEIEILSTQNVGQWGRGRDRTRPRIRENRRREETGEGHEGKEDKGSGRTKGREEKTGRGRSGAPEGEEEDSGLRRTGRAKDGRRKRREDLGSLTS